MDFLNNHYTIKQFYLLILCFISFALPSHSNTNSSSDNSKACYQGFQGKNDNKERIKELLSLTDPWPESVSIYTDGASRKNPGHSAFGLQIVNMENKIIYEDSGYLGPEETNNFAEYQGVIRALKLAKQKKITNVVVYSDSQLVIDQLNGKSRVKSPNLKPLFSKCQKILKAIPSCKFIHIPRKENKGADKLANQVLDNL